MNHWPGLLVPASHPSLISAVVGRRVALSLSVGASPISRVLAGSTLSS